METTVVIEKTKEGQYSCYMEELFPEFGLAGFGETVEEAKRDMLVAYDETGETLREEGKEMPKLEFVYKYDLQSVPKIAKELSEATF